MEWSKKKTCLLYGTIFISAGLVVGICLTYTILKEYFIAEIKTPDPIPTDHIHDVLFNNIDSKRIEYLLKKLSKDSNYNDLEDHSMFIHKLWSQLGLTTSFANYSVLMSNQNGNESNYIIKFDKNDRILYKLRANNNLPYFQSPEKSLNGTPIYVNLGRLIDFHHLSNMSVSVRGHIVMARLSNIPVTDIMRLAIEKGALALILFKDSFENLEDDHYVTDNEESIIWGTGDPQTPLYPSTENAYRLPINDSQTSRISVLSIRYEHALYLLNGLKGEPTPESWKIHTNNTFMGPEYEDQSYISLEINTYLKETTIHNTIGVIEGCTEPDRYVLVGNGGHTTRGTAALITLSEAFAKTVKSEKWCPYRTIVFCSWPPQYRYLGMTEWMEDNQFVLANNAIAYMSVDFKIDGNFTFMANSVPILYETITTAIETVDEPNPQKDTKTKTLYLSYYESRESPIFSDPDIGLDCVNSPFIQMLGIPVMEYLYDCDKKNQVYCEAPHHLIYNPMDNDFNLSKTLMLAYTETLRLLADRPMLPFSDAIMNTYFKIDIELDDIEFTDQSLFDSIKNDLDNLKTVLNQFRSTLLDFKEIIMHTNEQDDLLLRKINDILMQLERTYIDSEGIPYSKEQKHLFYAPEQYNSNKGQLFPGLKRLLWTYSIESEKSVKQKIVEEFKKHISIINFHLNSAIHLLRQTFDQL